MPTEEELDARIRWLERQAELTETHFTAAFWTALDAAYDSILPHRKIACPICDHTDDRNNYGDTHRTTAIISAVGWSVIAVLSASVSLGR